MESHAQWSKVVTNLEKWIASTDESLAPANQGDDDDLQMTGVRDLDYDEVEAAGKLRGKPTFRGSITSQGLMGFDYLERWMKC